MTAVGFTYMLGALTASDDSVVFTIGVLLASLYFVVFAHMLLAYPDGRLERPLARAGCWPRATRSAWSARCRSCCGASPSG